MDKCFNNYLFFIFRLTTLQPSKLRHLFKQTTHMSSRSTKLFFFIFCLVLLIFFSEGFVLQELPEFGGYVRNERAFKMDYGDLQRNARFRRQWNPLRMALENELDNQVMLCMFQELKGIKLKEQSNFLKAISKIELLDENEGIQAIAFYIYSTGTEH